MAVTRGGGSVGVRTSLLSEWLRGGSWGDCRPYKLTFCLFPRAAHLKQKEKACGSADEENCGNRNPRPKIKIRELAVAGENPWAAPVKSV
ncbi:UNVERIFIED_CONTAM: hypothetical protein FKN15_012262 [Acipenser sinensis]